MAIVNQTTAIRVYVPQYSTVCVCLKSQAKPNKAKWNNTLNWWNIVNYFYRFFFILTIIIHTQTRARAHTLSHTSIWTFKDIVRGYDTTHKHHILSPSSFSRYPSSHSSFVRLVRPFTRVNVLYINARARSMVGGWFKLTWNRINLVCMLGDPFYFTKKKLLLADLWLLREPTRVQYDAVAAVVVVVAVSIATAIAVVVDDAAAAAASETVSTSTSTLSES